jgi:hypothetical protein
MWCRRVLPHASAAPPAHENGFPAPRKVAGIFDTVLQALRLVRTLTLYLQEGHNVEARLRGEDYHTTSSTIENSASRQLRRTLSGPAPVRIKSLLDTCPFSNFCGKWLGVKCRYRSHEQPYQTKKIKGRPAQTEKSTGA